MIELRLEVLNGDRSTVGRPKVVAVQQHHYGTVPFDLSP